MPRRARVPPWRFATLTPNREQAASMAARARQRLSHAELQRVLRLHRLFLAGRSGGVRALLAFADLSELAMVGVDLSDADLSGASLHSAHLAECKLDRATLFGADLRDANLEGASLV